VLPCKKLIHGFTTAHILQTMELDLIEIRRLSPRGLWQLAPIRALIGTLLVVMKSGSAGSYAPLYMRMLARQSDSLREKIRANLNMRIKAWILQCPERTAWVRDIIGKAAIRHWRKNRLLDYALSKYFGDWKRKWPHGFKRKEQQKSQKRKPVFGHTARPYSWKAFALVKIFNVSGFLYGRSAVKIDTASKPKWNQPRTARTHNPIRFKPSELVAEAAPSYQESMEISAQNEAEHLSEKHILPTDQRALSSANDPPLEIKPP